MGAFPTASRGFPTLDEVTRDPMEGELRRLPWQAPVWDSKGFVPGFVRAHAGFWEDCILRDHPLRDTLTSYIRDGVDLYDLLLPKFRGESPSLPYNVDHFPQRIFSNHRWPLEFDNFVDAEMQSLLDRGCISRWADVKSSTGPVRPRMIMALSVETSKPRLIYDARPLNSCTRKIPFAMDTVARVASIASSGCYMTSLDDSSAFHHVLLRPSSWPLFGLSYKGVDYCWCVLPFGFSLSPYVYHTLSEAKAVLQRSKGAPSLAYLDDSWRSNFLATYGRPARDQWLAAGEATHVAMLTSLFCGQFLSLKKCELRPVTALQYLGIICDSETMTFRIPQEKLDKLHGLLRTALADGGVSYRTLQRVAGKCMSMTVAIRPASLWTHAMFAVLSAMDNTNQRQIDLTRDAYADLRQEFQKWLSLTASSHEGPWQRASHLIVKIDGSQTRLPLAGVVLSTLRELNTAQVACSPTIGYTNILTRKRCLRCTTCCAYSVRAFRLPCSGRTCSSTSTTPPRCVDLSTGGGRATRKRMHFLFVCSSYKSSMSLCCPSNGSRRLPMSSLMIYLALRVRASSGSTRRPFRLSGRTWGRLLSTSWPPTLRLNVSRSRTLFCRFSRAMIARVHRV